MQGRIGFFVLRSVIGAENSRHLLHQSDAKLKPFTSYLFGFERASVFTGSLDFFPMTPIGPRGYFSFGFIKLN